MIVGGVRRRPAPRSGSSRASSRSDETLRNFVLNEPRGGVFRHVNLLVPPKDPRAQMGWIIMEPADTPPMSGSNSICVATVLLDTGILPMQEPRTDIVLEAPAGLIEISAHAATARPSPSACATSPPSRTGWMRRSRSQASAR